MIDFTNSIRKNKTFNGASGNKLSIIYNGEQYMLKFSPIAKKNLNMRYSNSSISEYIGSNIFRMLGIPVQETILGEFYVNGKKSHYLYNHTNSEALILWVTTPPMF